MGQKFVQNGTPFKDPASQASINFFKKPKAPPEDAATVAARKAQIDELGKTNDQQNYLIKKLMLAQRGFRPFGAPAPVASGTAFAAPQTGADSPNSGIGSSAARVFGGLRAGSTVGAFRGGGYGAGR